MPEGFQFPFLNSALTSYKNIEYERVEPTYHSQGTNLQNPARFMFVPVPLFDYPNTTPSLGKHY
ncbi:MAG TPA: hypothetical protein VF008_21085, partial [Niastella sp.]